MIRSMFSAVSGLRAHQSKMDVIGNNIANVNTYGYKPGRVTFKESIYQTTYNSAEGNDVYGGQNPSQIGYGAQIGGITLDFNPGSYEPTGYGTDVMISGNGFFLVGPKLDANAGNGIINSDDDTNNLSTLKLTRVGAFSIDGDGYLVDENRNVVYGFYTDDGNPVLGTGEFVPNEDNLKPIRLPLADGTGGADGAIDEEMMTLGQISIDSNGILTGKGPDGTYKIAQIALCNVPNPNALEKMGDSYYQAVNNTGDLRAYVPGEGSTSMLLTGGLEMSRTDLSTELSNMIIAQRGFQANTKMMTVSDEMLQDLINMKR
ncbi:MAG: flagellar hook-basal body complex protein [Clostridiales bacterium]|nr:flagellar hook-basal body complex protein [Clostridiales bacterium]